ncbi:MAG: hypothetical protein K2O03_09075, partial [Lachnospiraceae bacterium]|nr:hypothetical protein [Lachnospiraceae bacterium]
EIDGAAGIGMHRQTPPVLKILHTHKAQTPFFVSLDKRWSFHYYYIDNNYTKNTESVQVKVKWDEK